MTILQLSKELQWFLDGKWLKLLFDPATSLLGTQVFALFIVASTLGPLFVRTGSVAVPAVMLALFAGAISQALPGVLVGVAYGVLWMSTAVAIVGMVAGITQRR